MGLDDPDLGNALTPGEGSLLLPEKNWCDPSDWKDWQDEVNRDGKAYGYDPLILNLDGKGIQTLAPSSISARFDHNADGIATATGWTAAGNGILALDLNNNGKIDSGKEIFGNHSVLPNGTAAAHGYAALAELDSNADGIINALDDAFSSLKVWQDINQDGISQANELFTLDALGIQSLNLEHQENSKDLGNGNRLTYIGSYTKTDGTTGEMGDVEFASNSLYSRYTDTIELTPEQLKAPNLQGLGRLRDLCLVTLN
ncbi:iron-regulated protein FrpC [Kingella kingae]|uniref:iron-regulated protein FrpC n=2 Tax=Kingella kingae TaxID=504 RepID=UPI0013DF8C11|nr:iron-regulated protein FrpC [Kingella kingae]